MTPRTRLLISLAAGTTLLLPAAPALADAPRFTPGAPGVGDSYFPKEGNGGYDVGHYDLALNYVPKTNKLVATARIDARAKQNLSRFDLDLQKLSVHSVKVNGQTARFTRKGQELIVTPAHGLRKGAKFQVVVAYSGTPKPINSPVLGKYGWIKTPDGAYVVCEPDGASTWFPGNDHPQDKATFTFRVTVPQGTQVLSNGELTGQSSSAGSSTFVWSERQPMATYLAMLAIGKYQTKTGHTKSGVPVLTAVAPNHTDEAKPLFDKTVAAIDWEEKVFGKYPFSSTGGIRVGVDVEFSLETQSRPIYGFPPDTDVIVHELAHQWFGDSVGVRRWKDIWLNEGFATYAEWLWHEQHGGPSAKSVFNNYYKAPKGTEFYKELWTRRKAGDPGAGTLFTLTPYYRGGMTLQALRTRIGDKAFFKLLKLWTAQRRYGYATTADFIKLAEKTSHKQLDKLFHEWLYTKHKPTRW